MKVSICMASFNREPKVLDAVLYSIYSQSCTWPLEVILVDDGSEFGAPEVCKRYPVAYRRIDRPPIVRNPSVPRNVAYRLATGDIIIAQSDDVVHEGNAIDGLVDLLTSAPNTFVIAKVIGCDEQGRPETVYTGAWNRQRRHKPLFFLGALWKSDLYAVGGNDEEFDHCGGNGGHEDKWFANCLMEGRHLTPIYATDVVGYHRWHARPSESAALNVNRALYHRKIEQAQRTGRWCSACGPWRECDG